MTNERPEPPSINDILCADEASTRLTAVDEALDRVQSELITEREYRREERFYWICLCVLMFDIFEFQHFQTWAGPIAICVIQLLVLVALGRKLGVDHIWTLTEKLIDKWDGNISSGK